MTRARAVPLALAALAVLGAGARADDGGFWRPDAEVGPREEAVRAGDYAAMAAANKAVQNGWEPTKGPPAPQAAQGAARIAIDAWERALALGPGADDADLHYRIITIAAEFLDQQMAANLTIVRHIDALRALDPLDPRDNSDLSWLQCMALSELGALPAADLRRAGGSQAGPAYYQLRAVAEYRRYFPLLDETQASAGWIALTHGNYAELLMATGDLDGAIAEYRIAVDLHVVVRYPALPYFGLAVAYDRDGQEANAAEQMLNAFAAVSPDGSLSALDQLRASTVFFVPYGDVDYYRALAYQQSGDRDAAVTLYRRFVAETEVLAFRQRACEHLR